MRFINIAVEDENQTGNEQTPEPVDLNPNSTEQAVAAVNNQDSTEPRKVLQVANYKEELAIINAQNKENNDEDQNLDNTNTENTDENPGDNGTEPSSSDDTGTGEDENTEPEGNEDTTKDEEPETPEPDDESETVAQEQYYVKGFKEVDVAIESMKVMSKYYDMLEKKSHLGGVNQQTARVITQALEYHSAQCGYKTKNVPALESYGSYTSAYQSSKELKVSVEGFLNDVWEAIKKFFRGLYNWVMDLLGGNKSSSGGSVRPNSKETRDKELEKHKAVIEKLEAKVANNERLREKDEERKKEREIQELKEDIAKYIFKTTDKGSVAELHNNVKMMKDVLQAVKAYTRAATLLGAQAQHACQNGAIVDFHSFRLEKSAIPSIHLEKYDSGKELTYEARTGEIVGGIEVLFVFTTDNLSKYVNGKFTAETIRRIGGDLSYRATAIRNNRSNYPKNIPQLDKSAVEEFKVLSKELAVCFDELTKTQEMIKILAENAKTLFEKSQPASWNNVDKYKLAMLKEQANIAGKLEMNLTSGYVSVNSQVNNYSTGLQKLYSLYI